MKNLHLSKIVFWCSKTGKFVKTIYQSKALNTLISIIEKFRKNFENFLKFLWVDIGYFRLPFFQKSACKLYIRWKLLMYWLQITEKFFRNFRNFENFRGSEILKILENHNFRFRHFPISIFCNSVFDLCASTEDKPTYNKPTPDTQKTTLALDQH